MIDKVALIFVKDRKMLALYSKGKSVFYTPGGKRERGETDEEALAREIKEELDVGLKPGTVKYYGTFSAQAHGRPEGVIVKIKCYTGELDGEPSPSSEIDRIAWVTSADVEKASPVGKVLLRDLAKKQKID